MRTNTCQFCGITFKGRSIRSRCCSAPCSRKREREFRDQHRAKFSLDRRHSVITVQAAHRAGALPMQPCEQCGERRHTVAHHDDYAKPLDVRWLCRTCHKNHHVEFGPGKNAYAAQGE